MDSRERQNKMLEFIAALPDSVRQPFKARNDFDILLALSEIGDKFELTIDEIHWLYEAVRRVLAGEDSPSNLVAFISEDERIEEDNRGKIPQIAQEIQRQIFDVALPILKQTGMAVKEGRVAATPISKSPAQLRQNEVQSGKQFPRLPIGGQAISKSGEIPRLADSALPLENPPPRGPTYATDVAAGRLGTSFNKGGMGELGMGSAFVSVQSASVSVPMDERHVRALARIAAGTNYSEERLIEEFRALPEGLKRAITTVDTANAIQEIAKKFLLHIDQMAALASETGLVLLGLTHPRDFVKNLARRLRVSETRALEIAREVSEQILGKVREVLRTLHESPSISKSQFPISKQTPISNIQTNKQESPKKLGVLEEQKDSSSEKLSAKNYQLSASATPYSPSAKWETGEETPTREEVLRGIENPTLNASPVGPTGWRPPAEDSRKSQFPISKSQTNPNTQIPNIPKPATPLSLTTPPPPPQPRRGEEEESFLEEKLAGPTGAAHTEKRYTIDPYREQIE